MTHAETTNDAPGTATEWLRRDGGPSLEFLVQHPSVAAAGAPVLFLHGAFAGAWCWQESWLPRVARAGRVAAAVSLRGHGGSEGRDRLRWTGLDEFIDDLALAIAAMPAPPVVVAHSLGGYLAQQILTRVLTRDVVLRGLVLVSSLPPEGLALMAPWLGWTTWLGALAGAADVRSASAFADRYRRSGDGTWNATVAAAYAACTGDVAFTGLLQAMIPLPCPSAWVAKVPALVLQGAEDPLIDMATARRTAAYHNAACARLPGAGHYPMLGRQAAAGADALCDWMRSRDL